MSGFRIDARVRQAIDLALSADSGDPLQHEQQEAAARKLGLTGAEIDAARAGRSFDVLTSFVLSLATAVHAGDEGRRRDARARARKAGVPEAVCRDVEQLARSHTAARRAL